MSGDLPSARVRRAPGEGDPARRDGARAADDGWGILSYLITGVFLWGGLGWLGDDLLGTAFLLPAGLLLGAGLALYTIYLRYGRIPALPRAQADRPEAQEGRR